jgi:mRNA interferase RelE/StbE
MDITLELVRQVLRRALGFESFVATFVKSVRADGSACCRTCLPCRPPVRVRAPLARTGRRHKQAFSPRAGGSSFQRHVRPAETYRESVPQNPLDPICIVGYIRLQTGRSLGKTGLSMSSGARYEIIIEARAWRTIQRLDRRARARLEVAISELAENPTPRGCRKLAGRSGLYRVRVGVYRIVYEVRARVLTVAVLRVGHRGSVYRGM